MIKKSNPIYLIFGILAIIFFVASAYGVQRTILSTIARENIPTSEWFSNGAWISIAFTLSGFGIFKALSGLLTAIYSQKTNTRNIIILGTGCFTLGCIPLLFSQGNPLILGIGNSFLGAGEGFLYTSAMSYLADVSSPSKRAQWMGIMELSVYGGYSFGALAAGFIAFISSSLTAFIFSTITAVISLILSVCAISSKVTSETEKEIKKLRIPIENQIHSKSMLSIIFRPTVVVTFFNGHISKMVDGIIILFLPLVLSHSIYGYGVPIEETGMIISVFTFTWAVSMPLTGRISDRIGRKKPVFIGFLLEALAIIALQSGNSPTILLFLLSALGGVGVGLYYPILPSVTVDIASEYNKTQLVGYFRAIKDFGYFTGPLFAGFVAQIWFETDSRLQTVLRIPLAVAGFLLILGALGTFLIQETRPGWAQFQTTFNHAQLVEESINQSTKGLLIYLEQEAIEKPKFRNELTKYTLRAKELEVQADSQLEKIVIETYQSLHKSPDSESFLRIARRLDRVAGLMLGVLFRIQVLPIEDVPPLIQEKLHDAAISIRSLVRTTVDVLRVLEIKIDAVTEIYHTIREYESELDVLYQIMSQHLHISSLHMHFGTWFAIKDIINMIEQAADSAEDAAEVINLLAIKYKA